MRPQSDIQIILPAAGLGLRLGEDKPKALVELQGVPILVWTLRRFAELGLQKNAVVLASQSHRSLFNAALLQFFPQEEIRVLPGGAERQESVERGLEALDVSTKIVVIHDAVRPFVPIQSILDSIDAARAVGAATVAIPSVDTILVEDGNGSLDHTPARALLWRCQTPQTFQVDVIRAAHRAAREGNFDATDDATLVRRNGGTVRLVQGSPMNLKITTPEDLEMARWIAGRPG